ncbi:hypothetical protein D3C85_1285960 [compost metagenome]
MVVEGRAQAAGELGAGVDRLGHRDRRRARRQSAAGALARGWGDGAGRDAARAGSADPAAACAASDACAADAAAYAAQADAADPCAASDADADTSTHAAASSPYAARKDAPDAACARASDPVGSGPPDAGQARARPGSRRSGRPVASDAEPGQARDGSAGGRNGLARNRPAVGGPGRTGDPELEPELRHAGDG